MDREAAESGDLGPDSGLRGTEAEIASRTGVGDRRIADKGRIAQELAVDVRGGEVHLVRPADDATGFGAGRALVGLVCGDRDVRPGEDVLATAEVAVVLVAPAAGLPGVGGPSERAGQTVGKGSAGSDGGVVRSVASLSRRNADENGAETTVEADPREDRGVAAARGVQREYEIGGNVRGTARPSGSVVAFRGVGGSGADE